MLKREEFKKHSAKIIDWIDAYYRDLSSYPVKSQVAPKEIYNQLPTSIPTEGRSIDDIIDSMKLFIPGITHWQHPNFHAYFPANSSVESVYAEMITAAIGAQCMIWETSPAAAELEQRMLEWMRDAMGLPSTWEGVIQDTASTATLVAIISAREKITHFQANEEGVPPGLRVYCSTQTHSSIEKSVVIAGIGRKNVIKIAVDERQRLDPILLEQQIQQDIAAGYTPCCVVSALGTTGTVAIDDVSAISRISQEHGVWHHIDAAFAGSALFLEEYQWMIKDMEHADSFVFNPHKWLFTNFDCTAYYVKDANHLIRCFEILPEYLKTKTRGTVNDYRDWGIPLGRRFRALKLWFVMNSYGLSGIQAQFRQHIALTKDFADFLSQHPQLSLYQAPFLNFLAFYVAADTTEASAQRTATLLDNINATGEVFLSHTTVGDRYLIRVVIGQSYVTAEDIDRLKNVINNQLSLTL